MLIDAFLPGYDVAKRHSTVVKVPADGVYAALRRVDLAECRIVRLRWPFACCPRWGLMGKS